MMSGYCSDCGKPLTAGAGFCNGCGASVSQRQQGFAAAQRPPTGYPPPPQQPYQPSFNQSSSYTRRPEREVSGMGWMLEPLRRYADFNGRSRRMEYWMYTLLYVGVFLVLFILMMAGLPWDEMGQDRAVQSDPGPIFWFGFVLMMVWAIANFLPSLAVTVRRLHDQDKTGWFYFISFIPYVGPLVLLVFMFLDGTPGPNQYGDDPKGGGSGDVFR
jgi:uncharacterized membrane protein YhaH (DUF805 family)